MVLLLVAAFAEPPVEATRSEGLVAARQGPTSNLIVLGALKPSEVLPVLQGKLPKLQKCLKGKGSRLSFTIDPEGRATEVTLKNTHLDEKSRACVVKLASKLKFPPAPSQVIVSYKIAKPSPG